MLPLVVSTILAKLAEQGLTTLAAAVQAKGKEYIESKFGIDLSKTVQTEEGILKLRELEMQQQEFLLSLATKKAEQDLEAEKIAAGDRDSARNRDIKVQESANASWLAKNVMHILALIVVLGGGTILVTTGEADVRTATVGLMTLVLGFYFGSSSSSRRKDETIETLAAGSAK